MTEAGSPTFIGADTESVLSHLRARGFTIPEDGTTTVLGGGISNVVIGVSAGPDQLVLKMPLARLRVEEEWLAPLDRLLAEYDALRIASQLTPGSVPEVRDCDEEAYALVINRAPLTWRNWKDLLLAGEASPAIATSLGEILAAWHSGTTGWTGATARLHRKDIFSALRLDPYYRASAERLPELSVQIMECARRLASRQTCLVHGDFSPKNVLVGRHPELWVVDFEVAHWGDPVFDLAFMTTHLLLKAFHRPEAEAGYESCLVEFCHAYENAVTSSLAPDWRDVIEQAACLLIARVVGKSPAEYLSDAEQRRVLRLGALLLAARPGSVNEMLAARRSVQVA